MGGGSGVGGGVGGGSGVGGVSSVGSVVSVGGIGSKKFEILSTQIQIRIWTNWVLNFVY